MMNKDKILILLFLIVIVGIGYIFGMRGYAKASQEISHRAGYIQGYRDGVRNGIHNVDYDEWTIAVRWMGVNGMKCPRRNKYKY